MKEQKLVKIMFICPSCGKEHFTVISEDQWERFNRPNREKVQDIFPNLNKVDREKFITSLCEDCQEELFK